MSFPHGHRAVGRIDRVLDVVARASTPPTMTEIATATGLPRSTTADLLHELRRHAYVRVTARRYRLGRRLTVLGLLGGLGPVTPMPHERLEELSRVARAPLVVAVLVGGQVLYVDSAGPPAPRHLRAIAEHHRPRPALRTAAGRLLLAVADRAERDVVLGAAAASDPDGVAAFERERPAIRRARLARSDGLADPGVRAVAVPLGRGAEADAALVVLGPRPRGPAATTVSPALDRAVARVRAALAGDAPGSGW